MRNGEVVFFCEKREVLCCFCQEPMKEGSTYVHAIFKDEDRVAHASCAEKELLVGRKF